MPMLGGVRSTFTETIVLAHTNTWLHAVNCASASPSAMSEGMVQRPTNLVPLESELTRLSNPVSVTDSTPAIGSSATTFTSTPSAAKTAELGNTVVKGGASLSGVSVKLVVVGFPWMSVPTTENEAGVPLGNAVESQVATKCVAVDPGPGGRGSAPAVTAIDCVGRKPLASTVTCTCLPATRLEEPTGLCVCPSPPTKEVPTESTGPTPLPRNSCGLPSVAIARTPGSASAL